MIEVPDPIIRGTHGLWYMTDPNFPGLFVAASTKKDVVIRSVQASVALQGGHCAIDGHTLHRPASGVMMTIPNSDWMTQAQWVETMQRAEKHIMERFPSWTRVLMHLCPLPL
jgi:hypothetical protein